jgi:hypothetical protein
MERRWGIKSCTSVTEYKQALEQLSQVYEVFQYNLTLYYHEGANICSGCIYVTIEVNRDRIFKI